MKLTRDDILKFNQRYRANLINSLTGFKSVALIGTQSSAGQTNLAIISQIIHVGANPPCIGVLFRPNVVPRHTFENILSSEVFTINHIKEDFVKEAHHTAARWTDSEFENCGFNEQYLDDFGAPYVEQSAVKLGCQLEERFDIQANGTHFVVASVQHVYLPEGVIAEDGFIDLEDAGTITCSGLDSYHATQKIARFTYAKPEHEPKEI